MSYQRVEFSATITLLADPAGWRGIEQGTDRRTRAYDTLEEMCAALDDGTAGWTVP